MSYDIQARRGMLPAILAWAVVVLPAAWGIWQTMRQSAALFQTR